MYKVDFYTLVDLGNGPEAKWVHGYGDGTKLFYYKTGGTSRHAWAAVHSEFGLALCFASTRSEVVKKSRNPDLLSRVSAFIESPLGDSARKAYMQHVAKVDPPLNMV
jgi:transglutaminase-like putative cysteine protease